MTNPDREEWQILDLFGNWVPAPSKAAAIGCVQDGTATALRRLASSEDAVKGKPEPVAWRDIIKRPDERPLPTYGQIPWAQLGRDVNDATFGRRADFEFSDKVYPGHQMVLGINFNSLARIVDKYRYYGLPCAAKPYAAPPADAWMREVLDYAEHLAVVLWSKHFKDSAPNWKPLTGDLIGLLTQIDNMTAALTAPGATTKSAEGVASSLPSGESEPAVTQASTSADTGDLTGYSEYTPVTVRGSTSDPSSTHTIAHDGFTGTVQGRYVTREGKEGVVLQQVGTRVVHVYGRKWIDGDITSDPSSTRSEVTALADIAKERQRQRDIEGWTVAHDDGHDAGEMASAAACYALSATGIRGDDGAMLRFWPWDDHWWKPTNRRRDLIKAGALIVAEIERLDRLDQFEIRRRP